MNNKGFMMAEVVVVAAIILVFMTGVYVSYNKIFTEYNKRVDYYDVTTLYKLDNYKYDLIKKNKYSSAVTESNGSNGFVDISKYITLETNDSVYLIHNNKQNIKSSIASSSSFAENATFKDYITFLSGSVSLTEWKYVMVMERCITKDNCKYAYLEVE